MLRSLSSLTEDFHAYKTVQAEDKKELTTKLTRLKRTHEEINLKLFTLEKSISSSSTMRRLVDFCTSQVFPFICLYGIIQEGPHLQKNLESEYKIKDEVKTASH